MLSDEQATVRADGCDDFVRKPYREREIVAGLVKQLGRVHGLRRRAARHRAVRAARV